MGQGAGEATKEKKRERREAPPFPYRTFRIWRQEFKGDAPEREKSVVVQERYRLPDEVVADKSWGRNANEAARTRQLMYDKIRHKRPKGLPEDEEQEMFAHLIEDTSGDEDRVAREVPEVRPADWIDPQERRTELKSALQRAFDWLGGGEERPGNPFADNLEARPQEPEEREERTFDELDVLHDRHTLRALVDPDTHTLKEFVRKADGKPYRFAQHEAIRSARLHAGPLHLAALGPGEIVQSPWEPSKAKLQGWMRPLTPRNPEILKVLTERQHEAFVWCYLYGLRNDQAAEKMGVKSDTIKEYLYFGRRRLEEATGVKIKGRRRGGAALGDSALDDVA